MRYLFLIFVCLFNISAQSVKGRVSVNGYRYQLGTTTMSGSAEVSNTQALITFAAPNDNPCTIRVSESPTMSPLVHAVDSALFSSADTVAAGAGLFVAGKRVTRHALDGNDYSLALQANTLHYWDRTCGSSVDTGTFTTANIPAGSTLAEPPTANPSVPGAWNLPTITGLRTQQIVDPVTGVLLSPVSLPAERFGGGFGWFIGFGGANRPCQESLLAAPDGTHGHLCIFWQAGDARGSLYYITTAGESRSLGAIGFAYPQIDDDLNMYCISGNTGDCFGGSVAGSVYIRHYQGDFTPQSNADMAAPVLYSSQNMRTLMHDFDSTFDVANFGCSSSGGPAHKYLGVVCGHGAQDSPGGLGIFYTGDGRTVPSSCTIGDTECPRIVAAYNPMATKTAKYCGLHNVQLFPNTDALSINWHGLYGGDTHDGSAGIVTHTVGTASTGASTITVTGALATQDSAGDTMTIPPVAADDVFRMAGVGGRYTVVSVASNVWTITPPLADPIASGTLVYMDCNIPTSTNDGVWSLTYWHWPTDIHGLDTTGTHIVPNRAFPGGGHTDIGTLGRVTETGGGDGFFPFNGSSLFDSLSFAGVEIDSTATFNGVAPPGYGNLLTKHPSYQQLSSSDAWFFDRVIFSGDPDQFGARYFSAAPGAVSPISGTGGVLYQYLSASGFPLDRKRIATQASTGGLALLDISSPATGNVLSPNAADNYKFCVANVANECRTGSAAGDIFFNVPTALTFPFCTGGDAPNPQNIDICITNAPSYSGALMQLSVQGTDSASSQARSRNLTYGLVGTKDVFGFPLAKALADSSFALFTVGIGVGTGANGIDVWKAKLPPLPAPDGVDRTGFINKSVSITSPGGTVTNAIIEFGYEEQGSSIAYSCTSRSETCVAGTSVAPFAYGTDGSGHVQSGLTGTACTTSCTISIPALSGHVLYARILFRNSSNAVVSTSVLDPIMVE